MCRPGATLPLSIQILSIRCERAWSQEHVHVEVSGRVLQVLLLPCRTSPQAPGYAFRWTLLHVRFPVMHDTEGRRSANSSRFFALTSENPLLLSCAGPLIHEPWGNTVVHASRLSMMA